MTLFFSNPQRIQTLLDVLQTWQGTPFMDHVGRKGTGADCVRFVLGVLEECGQMPPVDWPPYVIRHGGTPMRDFWKQWVQNHSAGVEVRFSKTNPTEVLQPGDVLVFAGLRVGNHVGIVSKSPSFWHSLLDYGVREDSILESTYARTLTCVWRPVEKAGDRR